MLMIFLSATDQSIYISLSDICSTVLISSMIGLTPTDAL